MEIAPPPKVMDDVEWPLFFVEKVGVHDLLGDAWWKFVHYGMIPNPFIGSSY